MPTFLRPLVAEFLGTFVLTLLVLLSITTPVGVGTPVLAALIVGTFVYTVGHISGTHLNPAVTIALSSLGVLNFQKAVSYILAQLLGAIAAMQFGLWFKGPGADIVVENTWMIVLAEALGAFLLVWGISSVVKGKVSEAASGLTIGASLLIGILLAWSLGSNGILNPAVAFGIGSFSLAYLVGPILGGLAGAWLYHLLVPHKA